VKPNKPRKIRTIPEKFAHHDVADEAIQVINQNRKLSPEEVFDLLPYIGYIYIDVDGEFDNWWYDSNDDTIRGKVVRVNEKTVEYYHYDSHHNAIVKMSPKFEGFEVFGNNLQRTVDNSFRT